MVFVAERRRERLVVVGNEGGWCWSSLPAASSRWPVQRQFVRITANCSLTALPNTSNNPTLKHLPAPNANITAVIVTVVPTTIDTSHRNAMQPPNMDDLSVSDSDSDALFDTPAARKNKKKAQDGNADASGKTRTKESHYTTEEAREAALRKELESVRNVNRVIEGVVESLEKAKSNMGVCWRYSDTH